MKNKQQKDMFLQEEIIKKKVKTLKTTHGELKEGDIVTLATLSNDNPSRARLITKINNLRVVMVDYTGKESFMMIHDAKIFLKVVGHCEEYDTYKHFLSSLPDYAATPFTLNDEVERG